MWKFSNSPLCNVFVGLAGLTATLLSSAAPVSAGGDVPTKGRAPASQMSTTHQSIIQIKANEAFPQSRTITVGRNKTVMIELPRELRDIIISDPEIVDAVVQNSNRVYLIGKKNGQSNAIFFDSNGQQFLTLELLVEQDTGPLDAMLRRLLPGSNIKTEILNDTLLLTGTVRSPIDASRAVDLASRIAVLNGTAPQKEKNKVINMLAVEGEDQVMLRVSVSEIQRTVLKQLGVNLGASFQAGGIGFGALTENTLPLTSAAGLGNLPLAAYSAAAGTIGLQNGSKAGGALFGNSGIDTTWKSGESKIVQALRLLERDGLVRTLAEPNLTAVSGETAKFLAGGEYPFPAVDQLGALSVSFKEFGVGLAFTPVVMSEGRISLKVEAEVSELDYANGIVLQQTSIPGIKKRQAKSTIELPSGGSMALAGLISDSVRQNVDGLPGLKDLPVLGAIFRSKDFARSESELVVIVTPYLVRPTSRQQIARPDDNFAPATDLKGNLMGHLNRVYGKSSVMPDGGLKGDYGFIVE